ncbi:GPI inositol deacylase, partial [Mortierella antarctica]
MQSTFIHVPDRNEHVPGDDDHDPDSIIQLQRPFSVSMSHTATTSTSSSNSNSNNSNSNSNSDYSSNIQHINSIIHNTSNYSDYHPFQPTTRDPIAAGTSPAARDSDGRRPLAYISDRIDGHHPVQDQKDMSAREHNLNQAIDQPATARQQQQQLPDLRKSQHPTPELNGSPHAASLPRRSERLRYSNGFSQNGPPSKYDHRQSHPTRRLSTSINSSSTSSPTSTSPHGALSSPTSPSHYALPYSHNRDHLVADKECNGTGSGPGSGTSGAFGSSPANGRSRTRSKSHPEPPHIPLLRASRSSTFGCSHSMAIVFVISFILLGCVFHSNFFRQIDRKQCQDTYMQPKFFRLLGFDRERTAFAGKYGLLLFRDQYDYKLSIPSNMLSEYDLHTVTVDKEAKIHPMGIPALFIPGNAGSAKQMRSIAKEASKFYYDNAAEGQRYGRTPSRPIDFFTVDFNEEFSALHGHSLLEQAEYLNDAIAYILSLYKDEQSRSDPSLPRPTSVLIVGHSMGGVVARSLFTMKNYRPGTVNTILTAATPHMVPPVTLDFEISNIYATIENFWSRGFVGPEAPLHNVTLISIAGGTLDIVVNGDSGNIHNIVPQSNGFTVFTSSIPHAWLGSDHVSILWCNQIATVIGRALIDVVDPRYDQQVKPLEERMRIFRNHFLTGVDEELELSLSAKDEEVYTLSEISHTFVPSGNTLAYPLKGSVAQDIGSELPHLYIMPVPQKKSIDTFTLLTNHQLGPDSRLNLLLCTDSSTGTRSACRHDLLSAVPIPASPPTLSVSPYPGRHSRVSEYRFISQQIKALDGIQFVAVLDKGRKHGEPGFLIAEFAAEVNCTITKETTTLGLLSNGLRIHSFPERPSLVSTLRLPSIDNSLLTYTLVVDRPGCHVPERFIPMMQQSSWTMYEDRYAVNLTMKDAGVDINFHGDIPYYERVQLPGKKGLEFRFWMDPSCPVPLSINLQVDKYGSMGKVVIRYRMVVLVFTFLVVILTLRAQFRSYNRGEAFKPFGVMLSQLIRTTFWKFSVLLAVIAFLQSLQARSVYVFEDGMLPGSSMSSGSAAEKIVQGPEGSSRNAMSREGLAQSAYEQMVQARIGQSEAWFSSFRFGNALLGSNDTFFWFLAPVFFQIAIGIVIVIWVLLNALVRSVALALTVVSQRGGRYVIGKAIGRTLSKRSRGVRRRVITTIILFIMVATFVPYQFAFVVAVLVHIVSCVRSLLFAQRANSSISQAAWDRYHYLISIFVLFFLLLPCTLPVLMVWIRNLSVQWYEPFSSDHRLDYIAPFIFFVEAVTDGAMVPRTPEKGYAALTMGILNYIIVFLIMFGVRYSWQIFFMSRLWIVWLLILQLKDAEPFSRLFKAIEAQ